MATSSPQLVEVARLAVERKTVRIMYRQAVRQACRRHSMQAVADAAGVTRQTIWNIVREEHKP